MDVKFYRVYYIYRGSSDRVLCGVFPSLRSARDYVRKSAVSHPSFYSIGKFVGGSFVKSYSC